MPREPFGWCLFCDDVRNEAGGKVSYMGVYGADIVFAQPLPVVVPQFAIVANYMVDIDDEVTEDVILEVRLPGDEEPLVRSAVPMAEVRRAKKPQAGARYLSASAKLIISPCEFKAEGFVEVWITRGSSPMKIGSLAVKTTAEVVQAEP